MTSICGADKDGPPTTSSTAKQSRSDDARRPSPAPSDQRHGMSRPISQITSHADRNADMATPVVPSQSAQSRGAASAMSRDQQDRYTAYFSVENVQLQTVKLSTVGSRALPTAASSIWNSLSENVVSAFTIVIYTGRFTGQGV